MKHKQHGFSAVHILLLLVVLGILGLVGWVVWQNQNNNAAGQAVDVETELAPGGDGRANPDSSLPAVDKAAVPSGWTVETVSDGRIVMSDITGCSVDVLYTGDTAETQSPSYDQKQLIRQSYLKDDTIVKESASTLDVKLADGKTQTRAALTYELTKDGGAPYYRQFSYQTLETSYTMIDIMCPTQVDLGKAQAALQAIKLPE